MGYKWKIRKAPHHWLQFMIILTSSFLLCCKLLGGIFFLCSFLYLWQPALCQSHSNHGYDNGVLVSNIINSSEEITNFDINLLCKNSSIMDEAISQRCWPKIQNFENCVQFCYYFSSSTFLSQELTSTAHLCLPFSCSQFFYSLFPHKVHHHQLFKL